MQNTKKRPSPEREDHGLASPSKRPHIDHVCFPETIPDLSSPGSSREHYQYSRHTQRGDELDSRPVASYRESSRRPIVSYRDIDDPEKDEAQKDDEALGAWCHRSMPSDLRNKLSVRRTDTTPEHADSVCSDLRQKLPSRGQGLRDSDFKRRPGAVGACDDDITISDDKAKPTTSRAASQTGLDNANVQSTYHDHLSKLLSRKQPADHTARLIDFTSETKHVFKDTPKPTEARGPLQHHEGGREFESSSRGTRRREEDTRRNADCNDRQSQGSNSHRRERSRSRSREYDSTRHLHGEGRNREQTACGHMSTRLQAPPVRRENIREIMFDKNPNQARKCTYKSNSGQRTPERRNQERNYINKNVNDDAEPGHSTHTAKGEIDYKQFLRRIREDFTEPSADAADEICVFLSQNVGHVTHLTQDVHDQDTSNKLVELLRTAFIESENCVNIRSQIMEAMTNSKFFESRLVNDLLKSLVPTRDRVPDEDDVRPMNHVLDILKVITRYRQMPHVDVTFFLNNLKGVLSQAGPAVKVGASLVTADATTLLDSINTIEKHIQETERVREQRDELDITDRAPSTDMDLPAIIPKVTDIHGYRKVQIAPRKALDVFCTASEYVRYTFLVFRQDFIGPLCKAIQKYREYVRNADRHSRGRNQVRNNQLVTQRFRNQSVRLYDNVKVVDTALSRDTDVDVVIKIDPSRIKYFNSRLKFGSLVCLSDNDFESMIFATVKEKDVRKLKEAGLLTVHVVEQENGGFEAFGETSHGGRQFGREEEEMEEGEIEEDTARGARAGNRPRPLQRADDVRRHTPDIEALRGRAFTMLESTAFYTSYCHPLEALSAMHRKLAVRQSSLPFKKQLLELSKNLAAPRYLQASDGLMSFECMRKYVTASEIGNRGRDSTQGTVFLDAVPEKHDDTVTEGGTTTQDAFLRTIQIVGNMPARGPSTFLPKEKFREVNVQKPDTWPSADELGLDNSQYAALQQALTKELALIQGPPGTGKTTIGVRIAEVLLVNEHLWRMNEMLARTPLLLISYTNHALDQFLAELLALPVMRKSIRDDDVVRVGSRCENEKFNRHNLSNLRKAFLGDNDFVYRRDYRFKAAYKYEKQRMHCFRKNRENIDLDIKRYTEQIVHENTLRNKRAILEVHYQSLQSGQLRGELAAIVQWLKLHEKDCGERSDRTMQFAQRQTGSGHQDQSSSNSCTQQTQRDYRGGVTEHYGDGLGKLADVSHARGDEDLELEETDTDEDEVDYYDTENEEDEFTLGNTNDLYARAALPSDEGHSRSGSPFTSDYSSSEMAVKLGFILGQRSLWSYQGQVFGEIPSDTFRAAMQKIQKEVVKNDIMSDVEESNITDIWQLDVTQRWRLYRLWLSRVIATFRTQRQKEEFEFQRVSDRALEQRNLLDTRIMRRARIVAMTTTGASRMMSVLRSLGPRVVIVEEAAQGLMYAPPMFVFVRYATCFDQPYLKVYRILNTVDNKTG